ncbi:hypothetical protein [Pseudomonas aeruginosa]|uniref:hypothetical protein n=1 Tax=Pseudomonas aeruginosa TaxID=287 RepID=UPI00068CDD1A|nr:hypothetical protein [Pseudomonas aeruginosa]MBA5723397.1 hypothetical protein [Pseudomonas aeruginosa]HCF9879449.1 hypothetical protein [Pseudomonas aeruginosa]
MSEVHRFSVVKMLSEAGNKISYEPHGPEIVMAKDYDALAAEAQALREEVAALRARVVVVPERKLLNAGVPGLNRNSGWNACLDELARLNGLTVSESALETLRRSATGKVMHLNNGLCPDAFEGHEARDPDCPVCRALIETGKESNNV